MGRQDRCGTRLTNRNETKSFLYLHLDWVAVVCWSNYNIYPVQTWDRTCSQEKKELAGLKNILRWVSERNFRGKSSRQLLPVVKKGTLQIHNIRLLIWLEHNIWWLSQQKKKGVRWKAQCNWQIWKKGHTEIEHHNLRWKNFFLWVLHIYWHSQTKKMHLVQFELWNKQNKQKKKTTECISGRIVKFCETCFELSTMGRSK